MVAKVQTDAPDYQTNGSQHSSGVHEPQAHLWRFLVIVGLGELDHEPVAQAARAQDFRDESTDNQANAQESCGLIVSTQGEQRVLLRGQNAYP